MLLNATMPTRSLFTLCLMLHAMAQGASAQIVSPVEATLDVQRTERDTHAFTVKVYHRR